ncbi:beta-carotene isomerase D27, chloroplastic isoform X2 [Durio zibethinus]|uniref:Beta-carotene isomerase D27, chloroplastic isoform X2 n=1 Tax=Durio zibethinus TaxID=66656 RepID=A0A6P5ZZB6_DURZI|nr:beta-carotene isomerase D27, chloroplastic isoform X2 [Durio zibethinus]
MIPKKFGFLNSRRSVFNCICILKLQDKGKNIQVLASDMKMKPLALALHGPQQTIVSSCPIYLLPPSPLNSKSLLQNRRFSRVFCSSVTSKTIEGKGPKPEYRPGILDDFFLNSFRKKLVKEVGWDSEKPGYDGLIELARALLMNSRSNSHTKDAAVRILKSLFPPFLLELYKILIAPIDGGKVAAIMVARVTVLTCQWLMGTCTVNSVDLSDGTSCNSGVFVERCKYLEESKCVGVCINTCKLPTQSFFKHYMGVPLVMEPNFSDYSCQFKFGVHPPFLENDDTLKEPCLDICPNANNRRDIQKNVDLMKCPKA